MNIIRALLLWPLLLSCALTIAVADAATIQDGPYVTLGPDGHGVARWVEGEPGALRPREEQVAIGSELVVPAVGRVPAFPVTLRAPAAAEPDEVALPSATPLFVMADTHGEFEIAVELLQRHNVIDSQLRWSFGRGHLAVLGDAVDRGPHHTEILWLLYKLEAEAARAGGGLHFVLGNHESMMLAGDQRYLNPKYLAVRDALGLVNYASLWSEETLLGQWLRTRAVVMKIGDYLVLHGGISRETVDRKLTLAQMNDEVRRALGSRRRDSYVLTAAGPQWYRGYFPEAARQGGFTPATLEDVDAALAFYKVKAIFVGHTVVPTVAPLYGGRVVAVQVYPHRDAATGRAVMEGVLVRRGAFHRARVDGGLEPLAGATGK